MKIVQIDGFRGLITAAFIGVCLCAGFVAFPGLVAMHLWNRYLVNLLMFPTLTLFQGILLWGIVAISVAILSKQGIAISFKDAPEMLSDAELDKIMQSAKIHSKLKKANQLMQKSDKFEKSKNESLTSAVADKNLSNMSSPISVDKISTSENKEDDSIKSAK